MSSSTTCGFSPGRCTRSTIISTAATSVASSSWLHSSTGRDVAPVLEEPGRVVDEPTKRIHLVKTGMRFRRVSASSRSRGRCGELSKSFANASRSSGFASSGPSLFFRMLNLVGDLLVHRLRSLRCVRSHRFERRGRRRIASDHVAGDPDDLLARRIRYRRLEANACPDGGRTLWANRSRAKRQLGLAQDQYPIDRAALEPVRERLGERGAPSGHRGLGRWTVSRG